MKCCTFDFRDYRFNNSEETPYGSFRNYADLAQYFRPYEDNGNVVRMLGYDESFHDPYITSFGTGGVQSPLYNATLNIIDRSKYTNLTNNFNIEWYPISGLTVRGSLGLTKKFDRSDKFLPPTHSTFKDIKDPKKRGSYALSSGESHNISGSINLSYYKLFAEKHLITAGADFSMRENKSSGYSFSVEGFPNESITEVYMGLRFPDGSKPAGSESLSRSVGITGTVNYTFDNRYYLDISIRSDGNSAFGAKKRFGTFWSTGLGWNLHNESFFKDIDVINRLKLRGSMGVNGSENFDPYQAMLRYRYITDTHYHGRIPADLTSLGNENLRWQQSMNYNIGMDIDLFDNRLSVVFDLYSRTTKDLISSLALAPSKGFASYPENIGKIKNTGFELKLSSTLIKNTAKQITWNVSGSIIHNRNKIVKLSEAMHDAQATLKESMGSSPSYLYQEGKSTNTLWAVRSLGVNPVDGTEIFLDRYGNITREWNAADLVDCGVSTPDYQGNLNTSFHYRNWSVTVSFGYHFGGESYNQTLVDKVDNAQINLRNNLDRRYYYDRWRKTGDEALYKNSGATTNVTSRFVQADKMFNCQNIYASYFLSNKKIEKYTGISRLEIYGNVSDAFYTSTVRRERGTDYPFSRNFSFGVNLTF